MPKLGDIARVVKSANAGASSLTFDIECHDAAGLRWVVASGTLVPERIAWALRIDPSDVRVFVIEALDSVKITVPRRDPVCGQDERDFDGVQQFVPLLDLEVS